MKNIYTKSIKCIENIDRFAKEVGIKDGDDFLDNLHTVIGYIEIFKKFNCNKKVFTDYLIKEAIKTAEETFKNYEIHVKIYGK